ncbi:peptidase C14, caspase domain-containing protein [Desarmillaria tabescens]|uniref:Peptidase C14, caspase domain-containing protein n=1 Tax=Armillaria tabescens TaxID=1929756 RepID=A0AA39JEF9_ARMTA|nr:peptidase C14, caspase domain-containing protein [Desarmillaria tabescens]KAK0440894.1 peptidase C14, caspase domain-containing protein [Desarmillaria tabescens]
MASPPSNDSLPHPNSIEGSRFWAVLIGIDAYPSSPLNGCVSDALAMKEYITNDLGVPEDHIQCLLSASYQPSSQSDDNDTPLVDNGVHSHPGVQSGAISVDDSSNPTRTNIVETLLGLSTSPLIQKDDIIIIYFAGHGSIYLCSDYHQLKPNQTVRSISSRGSIEALCPVDRNSSTNNGAAIPDISDREINIILSEISRNKGHRITFIADCCHSSGVTRDVTTPFNVRRAKPLPPTSIQVMLQAAHARLKELSSYRSVFEGNWNPDKESHVVLAACAEFQHAKEDKGASGWNGVFTQALINALKSKDLKEQATYTDLILALEMPSNIGQTPVVAGMHMNARLWYQDYTDSFYNRGCHIL